MMHPISHFPSYNPVVLLRSAGFFGHHGFTLSETPPLHGKIAVITGGSRGIGREISAQLLIHGIAKVYILALNRSGYDEAREFWAETKGITMDDSAARTEFIRCDLCDVREIKKVADELYGKLGRLDMLFNNAASSLASKYELSPQGIETVFATNHIGTFTLTNLLLPLLKSTAEKYGDARVVTTSSALHLACQAIDFNSIVSPTQTKSLMLFDSTWRYSRSKLANVLFTRELAHRLDKEGVQNVYINCFHPGNIATDAVGDWKHLIGTFLGNVIFKIFSVVGQSTTDAATTAIFLAASNDVAAGHVTGEYFIPIATEDEPSLIAEDKDLSKNLWYWSDNKVAETLGKNWATSSMEAQVK